MTKIPKFENLRWRTTATLKMVSSLYLSCRYHPISMKFVVPLHDLVPRLNTLKYQNFANSKWRTAALFVSDYMSAYRFGGCSELIGDVLLC